jgi:hypothetical protein
MHGYYGSAKTELMANCMVTMVSTKTELMANCMHGYYGSAKTELMANCMVTAISSLLVETIVTIQLAINSV